MNRGLRTKVSAVLSGDTDFVKAICDWLYSFTSDIESEFEETDSLSKLKTYVKNAKSNKMISGSVIEFVENFIRVSFETQLDRLSKRHYMHLFSHWVAESCFVESANNMIANGVYASILSNLIKLNTKSSNGQNNMIASL